jgi:hypothetical protein
MEESGLGCWPGIFVPAGKTLIIDGSGSLTASSGGDALNKFAPGIGGISTYDINVGAACGNIEIRGGSITASGGWGSAAIGGSQFFDCGTITITGTANVIATGDENGPGIGSGWNATCKDITISTSGTVTATGGQYGAGIGTGYAYSSGGTGTAQCFNILISKGTVTATGGLGGAGIGTGQAYGLGNEAKCGNITITNTVTRVTVTKGDSFIAVIGRGRSDNSAQTICGTVKFGDITIYNGSYWTTPTTNGETYDGLSLTITKTTYSSDTWTLTPTAPAI